MEMTVTLGRCGLFVHLLFWLELKQKWRIFKDSFLPIELIWGKANFLASLWAKASGFKFIVLKPIYVEVNEGL